MLPVMQRCQLNGPIDNPVIVVGKWSGPIEEPLLQSRLRRVEHVEMCLHVVWTTQERFHEGRVKCRKRHFQGPPPYCNTNTVILSFTVTVHNEAVDSEAC